MDETPTKLFLETSLPTSASPYPSPSSAFYPPPIPASHEFANKLAGNKRYRGSGGGGASAGAASPNGTAAANTLTTPSSANSSRRGSASAPSPLATHTPLMAKLDGVLNASLEAAVKGSRPSAAGTLSPRDDDAVASAAAALSPSTPTPTKGDSTASHDRIHTLEDAASTPTLSSHPPPSTTTPVASNPPHSNTHQEPTPSTPPRPTPTLTTTTTTASPPPASKRTSQILEVLTPTRAAPPSPSPSRRGSLIRRGSSRRWSATNIAAVGGGTPGLTPGAPGGEEGYFGNAANASEMPTDATTTTTTATASKRASRRLSAFNPLASTMEGQVATFSEITPGTSAASAGPDTPTPAPIAKLDGPSSSNPIPHTDTDAQGDGEAAKAAAAPESNVDDEAQVADTAGASPCKPILVADFAFPEDDPRFSKRPLQLLSRAERAELGPDAAGYGAGPEEDEDEEEDDGDAWGWLSRPRPRVVEDEEEDEEEMTPRFGYSYGGADSAHAYTNGTSASGADGISIPTTTAITTSSSLSATSDANTTTDADGGGGDYDPDSPLPPGIYRALYAFEAEGTAEMSLAEGQLVRVVGRGGGVGWAVVERGWRPESANAGGLVGGKSGGGAASGEGVGVGGKEESLGALGMAGQALVPEGYLDIWMLDGEEWDQEADVGGGAGYQ